MRRLLPILAIAVAVVVLPSLLLAEDAKRPGRPGPEALFKRFDVNQDRQLTADEIPPAVMERIKPLLKRADKNDDKKVSFEEFTEAVKNRRGGPPHAGGPPNRPGSPGARPGPHRRPGPPHAGGPGARMPDPKVLFILMDIDEDKMLSPEEFGRGMKRLQHARMAGHGRPGHHPGHRPGPPKGRQGTPHAEKMKRMAEVGREMFKRADKNKDGKLSKEEAPGPLKEHFSKIDANSDGQLGPEEIKRALRTKMAAEMKKRRAGQGKARAEGVIERLKAADKNKDGKLSKEEAPGPLKEHFSKIDANSDGQLTREELKKAWEAKKAAAGKK